MKYAEWIVTVPSEITNDPIWKLEVYRLALFAGDIGWHDVLAISKEKLMWSVADQLHRSLGSISANLTEGYSRSKGLDRARLRPRKQGLVLQIPSCSASPGHHTSHGIDDFSTAQILSKVHFQRRCRGLSGFR